MNVSRATILLHPASLWATQVGTTPRVVFPADLIDYVAGDIDRGRGRRHLPSWLDVECNSRDAEFLAKVVTLCRGIRTARS